MERTYRLTADWHTHTVWSHGSGRAEDNVLAARARGIMRIGISDHGPGHLFFGYARARVPEMRAEIERLRAKYPDMEIRLGAEANITDRSGASDVDAKDFDYVLAGYHYGAFGPAPAAAFWLMLRNVAADKTGVGSGRNGTLIRRNTELAERALRENRFMAITHPGDKGPADIEALARVCAETGTLFEINTWHNCLTPADVRTAARTAVRFVIGSDAHSPERVGDCASAVKLILEAGLDPERVVNLTEVSS